MVPYTMKKTKGRQKVEIKLMQNQSNLHVTFSKRRSGVFKKAHELAVMCGAEPAVIIFSPGEKVHTYGHPTVKTIIDRYLQGIPSTSGRRVTERPQNNEMVEELNRQLIELEIMLEAEREKGRMLKQNQLKKQMDGEKLWEAPIGELNLEQLEQVRKEIKELKLNVDIHKTVIQVAREGTSSEAGPSVLGYDPPMAYSGASFTAHSLPGLGHKEAINNEVGSSGVGHDAFMPSFGASSSVPASVGPGRQASFTYATGPSGLGHNASMPYFNASLSNPAPFGFGRGASVTYDAGPSWRGHNDFMAYSGVPFSVSSQVESGQEPLGNYNASVSFGRSGSVTTSQIGPSGFVEDSSQTHTGALFSDCIPISESSFGRFNQAISTAQYDNPLAVAGETESIPILEAGSDGFAPDGSAPNSMAPQDQCPVPS